MSTHDHELNKPSVRIFVKDDSYVEVEPKEFLITNETDLLNFTCKSKSRQSTAGISWTVNGDSVADVDSRIKIFDNGTLTLKNPTGKHSGVYVCEMKKAINFLKVEGPGYVDQKHSESQNLMQGDTATIECDIHGFPVPTVRWLIGDKELDNSSERIFYKEKDGIARAILEIRSLEFSDRATYTCRATNKHGSGEGSTLIRVKDKLAALWPFLGIVAEVVVLVTIIFLYEKRRARKEGDETEDAAEQKKALTEGGSAEVRQRPVKA